LVGVAVGLVVAVMTATSVGMSVVAFETTEGSFGFEHPCGDPALLHCAVAPVLHSAGRRAADRDHRLDAVRVRQRLA